MSTSVLLNGLEVEGWDDEDIAALNERIATNDARRRASRNAQNRASNRRRSSVVETRRQQLAADGIRADLRRLAGLVAWQAINIDRGRYWAAENDRRYKRGRQVDARRIGRAWRKDYPSWRDDEWDDPTFDAVCERMEEEAWRLQGELAALNSRPVDDSIGDWANNHCLKKRYKGRRDAERALLAFRRKYRPEDRRKGVNETAAYRCPECGWFHLTSQAHHWTKPALKRPWMQLGDGNVHAAGNGKTGRMSTTHRGRKAQSALMTGTRPEQKPKGKK